MDNLINMTDTIKTLLVMIDTINAMADTVHGTLDMIKAANEMWKATAKPSDDLSEMAERKEMIIPSYKTIDKMNKWSTK